MDNMKIEVKGKQLIITVEDITKPGALSSTGKTKLVASTRGAVPVAGTPDGLKVALNVTVPA